MISPWRDLNGLPCSGSVISFPPKTPTWVESAARAGCDGLVCRGGWAVSGPLKLTLRLHRAVLATTTTTVIDAGSVKCAAHYVISNAGKILHTTAPDKDDRVFLKVVAFTPDVGGDLNAVGQPDTRYFAKSRVRLLRRNGLHLQADATLLWTSTSSSHPVFQRVVDKSQRRSLGLRACTLARLAHQLVRCRHYPALDIGSRRHVFSRAQIR